MSSQQMPPCSLDARFSRIHKACASRDLHYSAVLLGVGGGGGSVKSRFCGSGLNCASQWLCCVKKATEVTLVIWSKAPEKEQG